MYAGLNQLTNSSATSRPLALVHCAPAGLSQWKEEHA
jgi:hypothetical protein